MIIRAAKNRNYTVINNTVLNDDRLTLKARGLAAYLLTKPDNWEINVRHLSKEFPKDPYAVRGALKELEECGYLERTKRRLPTGKYEWESTLYEVPVPCVDIPCVENQHMDEKPCADLPCVEKPCVENPRIIVSTVEVSTVVPSTVKPLVLDDKGDTKIVAAKLESAGVILSALLMEQYADLVSTYGLRPVLDGITAATLQSKQHSFKYVAACTRNIYDGTSRTRQTGNGAGAVGTTFAPPELREMQPRQPTVEEMMWRRLDPGIEKLARQFGTFVGDVFVPRSGEYKRAKYMVQELERLGIQIGGA